LDFLQSAIPSVKSEPQEFMVPSAEDSPSRSATLDSGIEEDGEDDDDDDYVPSAELAAAFAAMANASAPILPAESETSVPGIPHVKLEPQNVDMGASSITSGPYESSQA
jgi:hypothetical protein